MRYIFIALVRVHSSHSEQRIVTNWAHHKSEYLHPELVAEHATEHHREWGISDSNGGRWSDPTHLPSVTDHANSVARMEAGGTFEHGG